MIIWKKTTARFKELALPHADAVYRFARHLTRNEADAEDLTQDCFHLAYRKFHQFRDGTNCRAWLFRIARNAHIDRLRRKRREPTVVEIRDELRTEARDRGAPRSVGAVSSSRDPLEERQSQDATQRIASWSALSIDDENVFCDMFGDEINRFLAELPSEFRVAVVLCDAEGFSYQEIADILSCPIGTVRSRIARARAHLRDGLYDYAKGLGFVKTRES